MKKLYAALAVLPLLGLSGVALAQEPIQQPMQLTSAQMDHVTAGTMGSLLSQGTSGALINLTALASGTADALATTSGQAAIVQDPETFTLSGVSVTLYGGAILATGGALASNN